ncbi:MAG TPA: hypothetical protein VFN97_14725 [Actinospica sp.]|nr:hypothetical protein [Actinospica sp.]
MTTATRTDLLSLTEDGLAALANRGLVKRAAKELAAGNGGVISVGGDGLIEAVFGDGVTTRLPSGSALAHATCTCAASGQCRHLVGLVLAYQATYAVDAVDTDWSPGEIGDETLAAALGEAAVEAARERSASGFEAIVHRGRSAAPRVELPACTVTFHVPGDPSYATTDAAEAMRGEAVVLAVWAFRAADAEGGDRLDGARVSLAGAGQSADPGGLDVLERAADVVENLLVDGIAHAGPLSLAHLRHGIRELGAASMLWPAAVAEDLADQVEWYGQRSARYEMRRAADLICEFQARRRAVRMPSAAPAPILGTAEPQTTELRRVRLVGLGCRIEGSGSQRAASLYFAHPQDGNVLVLRRSWEAEGEEQPRYRRIATFPLYQLAAANLVSEAATRSAARVIALGSSKVAKTSVLAVGRSWHELTERLLIRDYKGLVERLGARGPRFLRPRVAAEDVFVFVVSGVEEVGYDPAQQRLEVLVRDEYGTEALVRAEYSAYTPAALGALAEALTGDADELLVSAGVEIEAGRLVLRPIGLSPGGGERVVVPDLEVAGDAAGALPVAVDESGGVSGSAGAGRPIHLALDQAADMLVEHAHRGLGLLTETARADVERLAGDLRRVGLLTVAALVAEYARALAGQDRAARVRAWTDASIAVDACRGGA